MGNAIIPGKRRTARVMKVDGSTRKYRPPAVAGDALRDHPGHYHLLESEEVRRLGVRARPMDPDAPLKPGKLYFLVDLPRLTPPSTTRVPRRTWSGALTYGGTTASGGAGERLESLMLARRSASDVAATVKAMAAAGASPACSATVEEEDGGGAVRLRVRLPKAEVARLVKESRDAADAAERIMRLCVDRDQHQSQHRRQGSSAPATPVLRLPPVPTPAVLPVPAIASSTCNKQKPAAAKKEKRARFVTVPDEIIGF